MLAPSRVRRYQSSQYHEKDVGERYGKGKSSGPQRHPIKNHTSNGWISHFYAIKVENEEEVSQDLNEEREAGKIFYEEREAGKIFYKDGENTHTSCKNKSKGKRLNV